jgi:hypothetical protein
MSLFAVLVGAVAAYCAVRVVVPRWRDESHPVGMDLMHVAMGVVMAAMFVTVMPGAVSLAALLGFAAVAVYFLVEGARAGNRARKLRWAAASAAMAYMLVPAPATATAAAGAGAETHGAHHHGTAAQGAASGWEVLDLAFIGGMTAIALVAATALVVGRHLNHRQRMSHGCELVMSVSMAAMLAMG